MSPENLYVFILVVNLALDIANAAKSHSNDYDNYFSIARLFEKIFVLCVDQRCKRHQHDGDFWPTDVQPNVVIFDGRQLHKHFPELHVLFPSSSSTYRYHRFATLLSFTHMVTEAKKDGLQNVLYVEDDVQALPGGPVNVTKLQSSMANEDWDLMRFGALWDSAVSGPGSPPGCRKNCECREWGLPNGGLCTTDTYRRTNFSHYHAQALSPLFNVSHPPIMFEESQLENVGCVLKSTISVGVNKHAYDDIEAMLIYILLRMKLITHARCSNGDSPDDCARRQCRTVNATKSNKSTRECRNDESLHKSLPWSDVWLPTSFRNVYILPAVVSQQGYRDNGTKFLELCGGASKKPKDELVTYSCKVSIDKPNKCIH